MIDAGMRRIVARPAAGRPMKRCLVLSMQLASRVEPARPPESNLVLAGGLPPGLTQRMGRASMGHNDAKAPEAWLSAGEGRRSGWGVRFGVPGSHPHGF